MVGQRSGATRGGGGGEAEEEEATEGLGLGLDRNVPSLGRVIALTCDDLLAVPHTAGEPEAGGVLAACHLLQAGQGSTGL